MTDQNTGDGVRMLPKQATPAKAKQILMIASQELDAFTYREGYQLADPNQRAALRHTLHTEFNTTISLPPIPEDDDAYLVSYLVIINGVPVLVPEEEVLPFALSAVLCLAGVDAARRVTYRADMLPEADPS